MYSGFYLNPQLSTDSDFKNKKGRHHDGPRGVTAGLVALIPTHTVKLAYDLIWKQRKLVFYVKRVPVGAVAPGVRPRCV